MIRMKHRIPVVHRDRAVSTAQYQGAVSAQSGTPNTQSDGEGSVLPKRPPTIFPGGNVPQQIPSSTSIDHQRVALEERIKKEKINVLKQSVKACQSSLAKLQEGQSTELIPIPRPPVLPSSIVEPRPASTRRSSRSRPWLHRIVRGRSKRRIPDSGEKPSLSRQRSTPVTVQPAGILVLNSNGETSKHQVNIDKIGISQLTASNGLNLHRVVGRIHRVDKRPKQRQQPNNGQGSNNSSNNSRHLDPNHNRDQQQTDNNHRSVCNHNSLQEIAHGVSSSHSIHFTEGECSNT